MGYSTIKLPHLYLNQYFVVYESDDERRVSSPQDNWEEVVSWIDRVRQQNPKRNYHFYPVRAIDCSGQNERVQVSTLVNVKDPVDSRILRGTKDSIHNEAVKIAGTKRTYIAGGLHFYDKDGSLTYILLDYENLEPLI